MVQHSRQLVRGGGTMGRSRGHGKGRAFREEIAPDQRSADVLRTSRSPDFQAVQQMVAAGEMAESKVPRQPDPNAQCTSREWDYRMVAWRVQLRVVQGKEPLGEPGETAWAHRLCHRSDAVDAVKRSADYEAMVELVSSGRLDPGTRPHTPNPLDRTISKRHWERTVQDWRVRLRRLST